MWQIVFLIQFIHTIKVQWGINETDSNILLLMTHIYQTKNKIHILFPYLLNKEMLQNSLKLLQTYHFVLDPQNLYLGFPFFGDHSTSEFWYPIFVINIFFLHFPSFTLSIHVFFLFLEEWKYLELVNPSVLFSNFIGPSSLYFLLYLTSIAQAFQSSKQYLQILYRSILLSQMPFVYTKKLSLIHRTYYSPTP